MAKKQKTKQQQQQKKPNKTQQTNKQTNKSYDEQIWIFVPSKKLTRNLGNGEGWTHK